MLAVIQVIVPRMFPAYRRGLYDLPPNLPLNRLHHVDSLLLGAEAHVPDLQQGDDDGALAAMLRTWVGV